MIRIAELRKEKHLNQVGLGLKLNISQKMISAYESGVHQPGIDMLIKMSKLFDVSVDYIIGNSDVRTSAEKLLVDGLTKDELELISLFREMDRDKQKKAIGVLFALKSIDGF